MVNPQKSNQNKKFWVNEQLKRLDTISEKISSYIVQGRHEHVSDLDKLRKKIISDIHKSNILFSEENVKNVLKLISKNDEMIYSLKDYKNVQLNQIKKEKKCTKAYLKNF
ncbi:MAG: hypothetical protein CMN00_05220 [Rickettsiales bacterium]|nr:hypothetical protein [Rickettsiales bacterium]|tara:strand:+ start:136 stop:465 length:330 start_codon:yes stop_codon:yes gene_type:complete